jgi:hypothetical protein
MEEDPAPKPAEKTEAGATRSNPFKNPKNGAYHTFLGPRTGKAQRAAMQSLNATGQKSTNTSNSQMSRCNGVAKITQSTSQIDTTPWW